MERTARMRGCRGGRTAVFARSRLSLTVAVSSLAVVWGLGPAALPSGSAPTSALAHSAAVGQLDSFYSLQLHNAVENVNAGGVLTGIKETPRGELSGQMIVEQPLYGGGPFTGTVVGTQVNFTVTSTVPNPCNCVSLVFAGSVSPQGTMSGTYVGYTKSGYSENGVWKASRHATFECKLRSRANHKYVTTEVTYPGAALKGLLRARSNAVGSWQQYRCVATGTGQWALKSRANGKYVTTEVNYPGALNGLLRAQASKIGAWEKFTFRPVASCSCFALQAVNSKFVTADPSNSNATRGILRAHGASIGARQEFDITST